ncbi:hypothetical protein QUF70_07545 [Desulfobacterales bacterium HSG17]|nr:hypothetical protein [Desulfobacterales bacterium HSG17]
MLNAKFKVYPPPESIVAVEVTGEVHQADAIKISNQHNDILRKNKFLRALIDQRESIVTNATEVDLLKFAVFLKELFPEGCKVAAVIDPKNAPPKETRFVFSMHQSTGLLFKFFFSVEAAKAWLIAG